MCLAEVGPAQPGDRAEEVLDGHLGQRHALQGTDRRRVEGHIDAAGRRRHPVGVRVDGGLVHRVNLRDLGHPAVRTDVGGYFFQCGQGAPGQEHARAVPGEGARHRTADRPRRAVDNRVLALQQHSAFSSRVESNSQPP